jgi:hypothetical protein
MSVDKTAIVTKIIMGSLNELLNDPNLTYININSPMFSELKSDGERYVLAVIKATLPLLIEAKAESSRQNAEELMIKKLTS